MADAPQLPKLTHPLAASDVSSLYTWMRDVTEALRSSLTFRANMRAEWLDVLITLPQTDPPRVTLRTLTRRPKAVLLADLRTETIQGTSAPASLADTLRWDYDKGAITLPQFTGAGTTRYRVRLLVVED